MSLERRLSLCRTDCQWRRLKQIPRAAFNQFDGEKQSRVLRACVEREKDASPGKASFSGFRGWRWAEISVLGEICDELERFGGAEGTGRI